MAAAIPVFLLQGLTAAFFRPLALAYTLAILASLAVALTVTPALALIMLRGAPLQRHSSPVVRWLQGGYARLLRRSWTGRGWAYGAFGVVILAGILVVPTLGQSLFPSLKQRDLLIHWDAIPGTSDAEVVRTTTQLSEQLLAIPGVRNFGAHIGRAKQGEEVVGINAAEIWVSTRQVRRLRPDAREGARRRRQLSGPLPRRRDLPQRTDRGGALRRAGEHHRARLRPEPRPDACESDRRCSA